MARAKQTGRSEARRRYRQSTAPLDAEGEGELLEAAEDAEPERPTARAAPTRPADNRAPSGRVGFGASFRLAYHPPNIREDIRTLPRTLRSRGFIAGIAMVLGAGALWYAYPAYSGTFQVWQLLVLPGSALAPQLVAGFFAPRASYLLGLFIGLLQPLVYYLVDSIPHVRSASIAVGIPSIPVDQFPVAFFNSVLMGALFAAMAAWYRRFLSFSSQRSSAAARAAASRTSGKTPSKPSSRRTASR